MKSLIVVINGLVINFFKNKEYPYFGTIVIFTGYIVLSLLLVFDFIVYHVLDDRDTIVNDDRVIGTIIISLIFSFNYWYFRDKLDKFIIDFKKKSNSSKRIIKIFSILYIFLIIGMLIYNSYLIRYNLKLF